MARVLPKSVVDRIQWAENHVSPFTTNSVAIGITSIIASDFSTKTASARAALQARDAAEETLRNKNNDLRLAMLALGDVSSAIVDTVHAKSKLVGDSVYSLASIPVPANPGPRPDPGQPTDFKVVLETTGAITLTWDCDNSGNAGTQYQIWRKIDAATSFTGLGATGHRMYEDTSIPAGSKTVTYQIQATRTTGGGPFGEFNVNFGSTAGGAGAVTVSKAA